MNSVKNVQELGLGMGWNPAGATSGCNREAAVEADAIGEQQLKRTQSGRAAAEADTVGEQLKRMQSVSSS